MRKLFIIAASIAAFAIPTAAFASVSVDASGNGFVGKGDETLLLSMPPVSVRGAHFAPVTMGIGQRNASFLYQHFSCWGYSRQGNYVSLVLHARPHDRFVVTGVAWQQ